MISLDELTAHTNNLLDIQNFTDYCPNGLQIAGKQHIQKIVTGVTACQALIDAAIHAKADALLVHHGYFWRGEEPCLIGIKGQRIKTLLQHDISLIAYHLPLDAHATLGNNVQLANQLQFKITGSLANAPFVFSGELIQALKPHELSNHLEKILNRKPLHIEGSATRISSIAWCTGAAQDFIEQAIAGQKDAYITGEVSERTTHLAREAGIHFFAAGHHATERYGIQALGNYLALTFNIEHEFIDIDNPV